MIFKRSNIGVTAQYAVLVGTDREPLEPIEFLSGLRPGGNTLHAKHLALNNYAVVKVGSAEVFVLEEDVVVVETTSPGWRIGLDIAAPCFPKLDIDTRPPNHKRRQRHTSVIEELRREHYNATITHFEPTHSDLWVLRVRPDHGGASYVPGQYASLGLGFWELRIDKAEDPSLDDRWDKLVRRSYSISSRMFDETGCAPRGADGSCGGERTPPLVVAATGLKLRAGRTPGRG